MTKTTRKIVKYIKQVSEHVAKHLV